MHNLLNAPCLFCGYNGAGYYQSGTHSKDCPWYMVGGDSERYGKLPEVITALFEERQQHLTGNKSEPADITPDCGKCSVSSGCDLPIGGKVCIQHFTQA